MAGLVIHPLAAVTAAAVCVLTPPTTRRPRHVGGVTTSRPMTMSCWCRRWRPAARLAPSPAMAR
jgi:hypothetical protein